MSWCVVGERKTREAIRVTSVTLGGVRPVFETEDITRTWEMEEWAVGGYEKMGVYSCPSPLSQT